MMANVDLWSEILGFEPVFCPMLQDRDIAETAAARSRFLYLVEVSFSARTLQGL
jgi:hypothetical protein